MNHEGAFRTNDKGELLMYNRASFFDFFRKNPSSQFTIKVEKTPPGTSNRLDAYFHAEVLPKLITGFRWLGENHNKQSIKQEIKKYSPAMHDENGAREWDELGYFEKKRCIDELIIFAATDLQIVIDNPL